MRKQWIVAVAFFMLATGALAIMPEEVVDPLGMPLVCVPAGKFLMDSDESPVHKVRITRDFFREDGSQILPALPVVFD